MPKFDHRFDNQIQKKEDLRFLEQQDAEEFATSQYQCDFLPRSVLKLDSGMHMVVEDINPHIAGTDHLVVFHINSMPGEG